MKTKRSSAHQTEEVGQIVEDLIQTVEKEVAAYQHLHDALLDQQASILNGHADSVSASNERVEMIAHETRELERSWKGRSRDLSQFLDLGEDVRLSQIIPLVEQRYAGRLEELREMLLSLTTKVQSTNKRNKLLLERSVLFVDRCMHLLTGGSDSGPSYGRDGRTLRNGSSIFHGVA